LFAILHPQYNLKVIEMSVYDGMTVNERLFEAKLVNDFDNAVIHRDKDKIIAILRKVELSADDAKKCCDSILSDPTKYGY
jgi:hypothetical protein